MNKSQIKKRAAAEFFAQSSAQPRAEGVDFSVALIMAGVPGAGKTEFINSLISENDLFQTDALRIDLDEIIKIFEEYKPEEDYKFRKNGNAIIEKILDEALRGGYNFILDGTFSGISAVKNIERAVSRNYEVLIVVLVEELERAKEYAKIRKEKTKREIKDEAYIEVVAGIIENIKEVQEKFVQKGAPVRIQFIKKKWNVDNTKCEYIESENLDEFYKI